MKGMLSVMLDTSATPAWPKETALSRQEKPCFILRSSQSLKGFVSSLSKAAI
jgi:hypothetical protein